MSSPISQIELAILGRLRAVPRAYTGLQVESYGAQLDDELFAWVRTLPATWVTFDAIKESQKIGTNTWQMTGSFEVLCAQRALVENVGRLGGTVAAKDVGIYQLLEDNKLALVNRKLGLKLKTPFAPGAVRPVMKGNANREAVVIYAQAFHTSWVERYPDERDDTNDTLVSIGLEYFLKPGDDVPDRTDLITTT